MSEEMILYFKDKIYKMEQAIEGLKACYEWFGYEDITNKIKHLEAEIKKVQWFIGEDTVLKKHNPIVDFSNLDLGLKNVTMEICDFGEDKDEDDLDDLDF